MVCGLLMFGASWSSFVEEKASETRYVHMLDVTSVVFLFFVQCEVEIKCEIYVN